MLRVVLAGLFCVAAAAGSVVALFWVMETDGRSGTRPEYRSLRVGAGGAAPADGRAAPRDNRGGRWIDPDRIEDGGFGMALQFTGAVQDPASLTQLRDAVRGRAPRGIAKLRGELEKLAIGPNSPREQVAYAGKLRQSLGMLSMYEGRYADAGALFEEALAVGRTAGIPPQARAEMTALLGIAALRRGELDNCVACLGASSCIYPIAPEAVHTQQAGSRAAVKWFTAYLKESPGDLRVQWLLNIAYMTLGEYPDKVPADDLIPLDAFRSTADVGRFVNVAPLVGLTARGPNAAGGSVFDDFTGDGLPDVFTSALDAEVGAALFVNKGDGSFEDRSGPAGLDDQIYALNVNQTDFDNDGALDVLLMRGGWETARRLSLLRNRGGGTFEDVTVAAGLGAPIQTLTSAWGDYDNDGRLDLFVGGEYLPPGAAAGFGDAGAAGADPNNRSRLYHNQGDGTFKDVAKEAGVLNERCAKGSAWGDYDGDGRLDLYVSNMGQESRLYHNEGDGTFRDVAPSLGVTGCAAGFACWFWDYDNDGRLNLYVHDNRTTLAVAAATALARLEGASRPCLYRNVGADGFRDVTREVGLDRPMTPMGCNFGDVDNDGYLDVYLGTGWISTSSLVPNLMFKNDAGRRFEDVTLSSGTGHLQKGHGVSFADWDGDGDLNLFVETGGPVPGDRAHNLLFRNPGHGRHWLKVKLVGTRTNRAALGAKIQATVRGPGGASRSVYRTVGNNSSFGGNSLVESIGLLDATTVTELEVSWPTSKTTQTFRDVAADQAIEVTEGADSFKPLPAPRRPSPPR